MFTAEEKQRIIQALEIGASYEAAAMFAEYTEDQLRREAESDPRFNDALRRAMQVSQLRCLKAIYVASDDPKNWRAGAWLLERLFPERFASRKLTFMNARQLSDVLSEFARVIADEVPVPAHRQRVFDRLMELTGKLTEHETELEKAVKPPPPGGNGRFHHP